MPHNVLTEPFESLYLSVRADNALTSAGVKTIGDLVALTPTQILEIPHSGFLVLRQIREKLYRRGLKLKDDDGSVPDVRKSPRKSIVRDRDPVTMIKELGALLSKSTRAQLTIDIESNAEILFRAKPGEELCVKRIDRHIVRVWTRKRKP